MEDERLDDEDFRRVWLPDDRVLDPAAELFALLLVRDAGGEDVRVAMVTRVCDGHTSTTLHTPEDQGWSKAMTPKSTATPVTAISAPGSAPLRKPGIRTIP